MRVYLPKIGEAGVLPGMEEFLKSNKKPHTFEEAIAFLRNKKQGCKVSQKWNEDVDVLVMQMKVDNDSDNVFTISVELDPPGDLKKSESEIIESAQKLWAYRRLIMDGSNIAELVEE